MVKNYKEVMVVGYFDIIHRGHIDHIRKAKALGDWLIVVTHPDKMVIKKKGFCVMPLEDRIAVLEGLRWVDEVIVADTKDGSIGDIIRSRKLDIFAKGGDRTPHNMPADEIKACQEIGCQIIYGIGDLINSSSKLALKSAQTILDKGLLK